MLELLIGKFLDSEITPAEQRLLDEKLQKDPAARKLLDEYTQLHESTRQVLESQVLEQGSVPREIFHRALAEKGSRRYLLKNNIRHLLQVTVGLAAGFLIGLIVYGVWLNGSSPPVTPPVENPANPALASNYPSSNQDNIKQLGNNNQTLSPRIVDLIAAPAEIPERRVDYFNFTDPTGTQYLIEAYRDSDLQAAAYNGGL